MTMKWTTAVLLSSVLLVACGERAADDAQVATDPSLTAPETAGEPSAEATDPPARVSPREDTSAATPPPRAPVSQATRTPGAPLSRTAPAAQTPAAPVAQQVTLPAGTALPLELMTALSSESATVEAPVRARLRQAVMIDELTVLPAGAILSGDVIEAERSGRVQGRARLSFRFHSVELDGSRESLMTNPITFQADATAGEDAAKIGTGAVGGAIIGGILGGGSGAARGAAIGGAAGTGVVLATRGREVELAAGTNLAASLAQPLQLTVVTR